MKLIPALGVLALVSACAGAPSGARTTDPATLTLTDLTPKAAAPVERVNWLVESEPDTLDLDTQGGAPASTVVSNICERLLQVQPDMTIKPWLARSTANPDPKTLVLTLRDDVKFHDGSPMTADDVLFSLKRHADPANEQSDEFGRVASIDQTGPLEITVRFTQPDALFTQALAGDAGLVYNREQVEAAGKDFGTPGSGDACSGPFTLSSWKSGDSITIKRHDAYRGEKPLAGEVVFRWASDSALVNALATGAADGVFVDSLATATAFEGKQGVDRYFGPSTAALVLIPTERGGLKDPKIRTALSLALDRQGISDAGFGGLAQPWATPVGSGAWGYAKEAFAAAQKDLTDAPARPTDADLVRAKQLVHEATHKPSGPIVIGTDSKQGRTVMANAARDALRRIGLDAEIKTVPTPKYSEFYGEAAARKDIDLLVADWYISKSDPIGLYDNAISGSSNNWVGFADPQYDQAVQEALSTLDDSRRAALVIDVQRRYTQAAVWISVAQVPNTLLIDHELTGPPASMAYLYSPWAAALGKKAS
ncbi:peptide/nickel transport system substrate-binding protein [Lentzea albidocapillata subsp. violacea]|uniref:Peptide/nickel transport system substrate-binding protein n=1 Tax=Lentzea albidocapillata subsp. violacea TaxID=128104 RepID=A0A1G8ZTH5_9PSEU|nr:ABC transporter substrate-binding protein [Lentzea albidocapillata]SDK17655.1 peptide/nickel transport system substrate-binding protein [Lentzea albidocapillata subsp. violacea]